jgi:MFS family permease
MKLFNPSNVLNWLPKLNQQVWILIAGRLLSGIGTGFTLFYAPIFFADGVGLSKTAVGLALGSASISGIFGRFLSGVLSDQPRWGRKRTLLLSSMVSALASFILASANDFIALIIGNLLLGFGVGLYWPATEAMIADLTTASSRHEAYALSRFGDSLGLQLGVVFGGILIALTGIYRLLFVIDGISFLVFLTIIWVAVSESYHFQNSHTNETNTNPNSWFVAFRDKILLIYLGVNILFTTYIAQIQTTLPLYFTNFVSTKATDQGFSTTTISGLFTWHIALAIVLQLPAARFLRRFSYPQGLIGSLLIWIAGFLLIYLTGTTTNIPLFWAIISLGMLALATVAYTPIASSFVAELAPDSMRGIYLSINSQCWAIGYFIGPALGGWALDLPRPLADSWWVVLAMSAGIGILVLQQLDRLMQHRSSHL